MGFTLVSLSLLVLVGLIIVYKSKKINNNEISSLNKYQSKFQL